jgi:hypothetical protein
LKIEEEEEEGGLQGRDGWYFEKNGERFLMG